MRRLIESGAVRVDRLLARTISLARVPEYLPRMGEFREVGVTVIAPRSDR
jgi:hypothetical protein